MKKMFMIHENTAPRKLFGSETRLKTAYSFDVTTAYVVTAGYVREEEDKDPQEGQEYEPIFIYSEDRGSCELNQVLLGVFFETIEEGEKALAKYLMIKTEKWKEILLLSEELSEKYPEAII